jgi:hypothetical protein
LSWAIAPIRGQASRSLPTGAGRIGFRDKPPGLTAPEMLRGETKGFS